MELFWVLIILAVLGCTLIGFITVLVWLTKLLGGSTANPISLEVSQPPVARQSCAGCGASFNSDDLFCMQCGLSRQVRIGSVEADLISTQRALLRMHNLKLINSSLYQQLTQTIETEQARLGGKETARQRDSETQIESLPASPSPRFPVSPSPRLPVSPSPALSVSPSPTPRRSFAEMMAAFMEESSIRWGELIGGLLIIGCSMALVVSLWSEIAERPLLKFGVFMSLSASLFGLGFYSAHRWKLPTTSRGVLLTATLLVPLNFLAVTAFGRSANSFGILVAEAAAWLLFSVFVFFGARVYAAEHSRAVAMGTMGASLALLLAKHFVSAGLHWRSWLVLGFLPIVALLASTCLTLRAARQDTTLGVTQAYSLFAVLGTGGFAALLPLGLLFARGELTRQAWQEIVPLLALFGIPLLAVGWFGWQRLKAAELATERTIATSLALIGAVLLAGSTLLAFPFFDAMLAVAVLNAIVFGWAAWRYGLRAVRWVAFAQTLWCILLLFHLALGHLSFGQRDAASLLDALTATSSAVLLLVVFAVLIVVAERLRLSENRQPSLQSDTELAATLCAIVSLLLATYNGFGRLGDPQHIVWIYGFYTVAAFTLAWRRSSGGLAWLGLGLLWLTCSQTFAFALRPAYQWVDGWAVAWLVLAIITAFTAMLCLLSERAATLLSWRCLWAAGISAGFSSLLLYVRLDALTWPYLAAIVFVALACAFCAWRRGWTLAGIGGGLLLNAAATLAILRIFVEQIVPAETLVLARLLQANLAVSAAYALVWWGLTLRAKIAWVSRQSRIVTALWLGLLAAVAIPLAIAPTRSSVFAHTVGDGWGWALSALIAAAYVFCRPQRLANLSHSVLAALALGVQTAATVTRWDHGEWRAYHVLLTVVTLTVWIALALRWRRVQSGALTAWVNGLSLASTALALRATYVPGGPWRSVVALSVIGAAMLGMQIVERARGYAYAAGALACAALTMWIYGYATGGGTLVDVELLNGAVLAGVALISLWIELRFLRQPEAPTKLLKPAFHQFVAVLMLGALGVWLSMKLLADAAGNTYQSLSLAASGRYTLLAVASLAALLLGSLWDGWHRWRMTAFYPFGLLAIAALIDRRNYYGAQMLACIGVVCGLYALSAAALWLSRARWTKVWHALRLPVTEPHESAGLWWLTPANCLLAAMAVITALSMQLENASFGLRLTAALASLCAPFALAWVIGQTQRFEWQALSLLFGFGALLACGWVGANGEPLHQLVIFAALSLMLSGAFLIAEAFPLAQWSAVLTRMQVWEKAVRFIVGGLAITGLIALLYTVAIEWSSALATGQAIWAKLTTTIFIVALIVSLLGFALWRGRDPFAWELTQRSRYVYAAEAAAVLLFVHVRLVAPWLFGGRFQAYWPFVILLLAFAGIGLSEQLRRRGRLVLADPLERTGVFLPLLPSLAFGLVKSQVDYTGVLLGVALFYGLLSIMRQSFGFALLAVLAANGGWWHWLQRSGDFGFFAHPQVWLIPAALSVLLAAHLNRQRLSTEQMTTLRYVALMTIYLSSTADIFLNGVAASPWLPLVLAVLSVAGVMLGMMLRVRAYLFLGTAFLLLAVITLVWHAAVSFGWRWLWYVAGIAFGIMIIYLFAMFERHRVAWLLWMERFKSWQA